MKKRVISVLLAVLMIFTVAAAGASAEAANLVAETDSASAYVPTNIINGSFDECPWMTYTGTYGPMNGVVVDSFATWKTYADMGYMNYMNQDKHKDVQINGVDEGWNTTETSYLNGANFEWDDGYGNGVSHRTIWAYNDNLVRNGQFFIEMNLDNSAVLYQDLTTHSGDIIRWSLKHGVRSAIGAETQDMRVEIGAPDGAASGINEYVDSAIKADTKAIYESTGVSGVNAYANNDELASLSLTKTANSDKWYDSKGVYVVPENQNVTRFAFVSISNEIIGAGNMLDDIDFSTLLGNLNAVEQSNGDVVISGYWGDDNADKKLCVKIGDETESIDMSAVMNKNFKITIPADEFESGSITEVEVYHQDYPTAKKSITITAPYRCPRCGEIDKDGDCICNKCGYDFNKVDEIISITEKTTPVIGQFTTLEILVSAPAAKIQFVNSVGATATYHPANERVMSIVDNADGTQTWTVIMMAYKQSEAYTAYPKFGSTWSENGYEYVHEDKYDYDSTVYSVTVPDATDNRVYKGRHDIIVETGIDTLKVQFAYFGTSATFTKDNAEVVEKDGHLFWTCNFNFHKAADAAVYDINTRTSVSSFAYSGTTLVVDVLI